MLQAVWVADEPGMLGGSDDEAPTPGTDPEPAQSIQHYTHILITVVLILSSHLCLSLRSFLYSWDFAIKFLYGFLFQPFALRSSQML